MSNKRIMVVEDEWVIADNIQRSLKNLGYTVSSVMASGEKAVQKAAEDNPDLILMDIVLHGEIDGIEAAGQIQASLNIPVVYLTAYTDKSLLERAKLTGPFGYIIKPFEERELHTIIEMALYKCEADEKLRKLSHAVEHSSATIVITDTNGKIEYASPKFTQLTGYTLDEAIGKNPRVLKSGRTPPETYKELWRTIKSGNEWCGEFCNKKKNGELYWESASISPVKNDKGVITSFITVKEDITERKKLEEELRVYREHLETLVEERTKELKASQEKLIDSERLAVLGKISGGIAHEIRNPLGVIDSSVYYLKSTLKGLDEKSVIHLDRISRQIKNSTVIIQSLQDMAKMKEPIKTRIDIAKVVEDGISNANVPQTIEFAINVPENKLFVNIDKNQISIVLRNFLSNAVHAMDNRGTIWITVCSEGDSWVEVSIKDTGHGIPSGNLERVFKPFFGTKAKGFGYGLTMCKTIMENHGGTIGVQSEEGQWTEFVMRLPSGKKPVGAVS